MAHQSNRSENPAETGSLLDDPHPDTPQSRDLRPPSENADVGPAAGRTDLLDQLMAIPRRSGADEAAAIAQRIFSLNRFFDEAPDSKPRYRVLELIGRGGMGTVFKAEQRTPVKRLVALKLVKPGFDSREVIARFESERQA